MHNNYYPVKICLLTPYTGSNLGDGAIQEAVIANIKNRYRTVKFHGLTLNPKVTSDLHKIECSPLTALPLLHYWTPSPPKVESIVASRVEKNDFLQHIKNILKVIPFVRNLVIRLRKYQKFLACLAAEFQLLCHGYNMLKDHDLLIVSGGGQLDDYWGGPWGHPFSLLKWGLIAKATGTRFVFLSVGTCTFESRISTFFIKYALKLADYRSYRDGESKNILKNLSFTLQDPVYPDIAFSHDIMPHKFTNSIGNNKPVIGISPIAYLSSDYWPEEDLRVYDSYICVLKNFIATILQLDFSVYLFYTSGTDKHVVTELLNYIQRQELNHSSYDIKVVATDTVDNLLSMLSDVDIVIASRLHAIILSHLVNKPVLAVSYDRKVNTYMEECDQFDLCLDIHSLNLHLLQKAFHVLRTRQEPIKTQLRKKMDMFKQALSIQYDELLNFLE